jgi:hypothetical protein
MTTRRDGVAVSGGTRTLPRAIAATATAIAIAVGGAGCGGAPSSSVGPTYGATPTTGATPTATASPTTGGAFEQIDRDAQQLVNQVATWHHPSRLTVDEATRVGLSIGTGAEIRNEVSALIAHDDPTSAGTVPVGPTVTATLEADPADATVTPSVAVDASTGSDVELLWTWTVRPVHPSSGLLLTAHLEIPLADGHTLTHDLPLSIPVARTFGYTLHQVFDNWGTWSAIGGTVVAVSGWWAARRRKQRRSRSASRRNRVPKPRAATGKPASGSTAPPA